MSGATWDTGGLSLFTKDELRAQVLAANGGPISPDLMDTIPDYKQWFRYFLFRFSINDAKELAAFAAHRQLHKPEEYYEVPEHPY